MARRRMLYRALIRSDKFIEMPLSTQTLYMHLNMEADDDGFVSAPKSIQRSIAASDDDLKLLIAKGFLIPFESGVIAIVHWKKSNLIQKDRYTPTSYKEEMSLLTVEDGIYTMDTTCIQNGYKLDTTCIQNGYTGKVSIGKDRIGKNNNGGSIDNNINTRARAREEFVPPTLDDVRSFVEAKNLIIDAERFFYHYSGKGWKIGRDAMEDWQATAMEWDRKDRANGRKDSRSAPRPKSGAYDGIGGVEV